jgi:hypothetical protein
MRTPSPSDRTVTTPANASPQTSLRRRGFLLSLGAGGAGAAAAALNALPTVAAVDPQTTSSNHQGSGYRESEHVRDYYRSARL